MTRYVITVTYRVTFLGGPMNAVIKFLETLAKCPALPEETQAELQDLLPEVEAEIESQG